MRRWLLGLCLVSSVTQTAAAAPFRLSLLFEWRRAAAREDCAGMLLVDLPLERLARPSPPLSPALPGEPSGRLAEDATGPKSVEPAPASRVPAVAPVHRPRPLPASALRRLLRAALAGQADESVDERLDRLASRMRAAAILPELMLRGARSTNESLRLSPSGSAVTDYTQNGGAALIFEGRATWKLDRLLFADEELQLERLRIQRERVRERLVASLLKELFAWQRARARLLNDADTLPEEERAAVESELEHAGAALDVLTDGAFSEELARMPGQGAP